MGTSEALLGAWDYLISLRQQVKVMVGGAPVTEQFAREIGADGYSENASSAVSLARKLVAA